tara:strand:+ start:46 stop:504 length:459 start_codon:yes stop_codon:yes gene_type:complete
MIVKKEKPIPIGMYIIFAAFSLNLMSVAAMVPMAYASAENPTCMELGTCMFANDPLNTMLVPFDSIFGGLSLIIFWSLVLGILWLRTENPQLVSVVGVLMSAAYMTAISQGTMAPASSEFTVALGIGGLLIAISLGIGIYHIISHRIHAGVQ